MQWYENVPGVCNETENCWPGPTMPESQPFASDVDVCAIESVLVHVTVVPTGTVSASGMKADGPNVDAPVGIDTADDAPPVVDDGDGDGDAGVEGPEDE